MSATPAYSDQWWYEQSISPRKEFWEKQEKDNKQWRLALETQQEKEVAQ